MRPSDAFPERIDVRERLAAMFPGGSARLRSEVGWLSLVLVEESFVGPDLVDGREVAFSGEAVRRYEVGGQVVSVTTHQGVPSPEDVADVLDSAVVSALTPASPFDDRDPAEVLRAVRAASAMQSAPVISPPAMQERGAREWHGICAQALQSPDALVVVCGPCEVLGSLVVELR